MALESIASSYNWYAHMPYHLKPSNCLEMLMFHALMLIAEAIEY